LKSFDYENQNKQIQAHVQNLLKGPFKKEGENVEILHQDFKLILNKKEHLIFHFDETKEKNVFTLLEKALNIIKNLGF